MGDDHGIEVSYRVSLKVWPWLLLGVPRLLRGGGLGYFKGVAVATLLFSF